MREHIIREGDCLWSLAIDSGHFWKTIWNDSANSGLRDKRRDPNVLCAGDVVKIPDLVPGEESGATEKRHRFVRKGVPCRFRLQLLHRGKPRASQPYRIEIDGRSREGKTDADGWVQISMPPDARQGRLFIGNDVYDLHMGHLDPVEDIKGVQQRLRNLGLYGGPIDGQEGELTSGAVALFQRREKLSVTGRLDHNTRQALVKAHHA